MKKFVFLFVLPLFVFTACEGPQGPPGQDGGLYFAQTFERTVDFNYDPQRGLMEALVPINNSIVVYESDAILVYRLEVLANGDDSWSLIPQNFFLNNGNIIQYVYNHTFYDIELLIEGNFDVSNPNLLGTQFTQNQTFRFVVVPAEFANNSGVDVTDYNAVMNAVTLEE